jgi:hypothetical protein
VETRPSVFARFVDAALFVVGAVMVAAGVVEEGAGQAVLILVGAGLMVMGAVLPRLSGTIKISPGLVEMTVVQQLEATRKEAERRIPEQTEEAVGLAFQKLMESGRLTDLLAKTQPSPPPHKSSWRAKSWRIGAAASVVGLLILGVVVTYAPTAPPGQGVNVDASDSPPVLLLVIAGVVVVLIAGAIAVQRSRRSRGEQPDLAKFGSGKSDVFARRIVDELISKS